MSTRLHTKHRGKYYHIIVYDAHRIFDSSVFHPNIFMSLSIIILARGDACSRRDLEIYIFMEKL